jgi:competence protein ComFC
MIAGFSTWASALLRAQDSNCVACGKPRGGQRILPRNDRRTVSMLDWVCGSCAAAIPWIDRIACATCGRAIVCPDCVRREAAAFIQNRSSVRYDAAMRQWLALYKYRGHERLGEPLAEMMCHAFERMMGEIMHRDGSDDSRGYRRASWQQRRQQGRDIAAYWTAVTFVPVSREREIERGFNQAQRFAEAVAARYRLPLYALLTRVRHSEKQSLKTRRERIQDMRTAFGIHASEVDRLHESAAYGDASGCDPSPYRILLIDDIYTTGGTVDACAAKLLEATDGRARVFALTWARS